MSDQPNNLAQAMEAAAAQAIDNGASKPVEVLSDFDRLVATGERLLKHQQERLNRLESQYQKQRTELIDRYRSMIERTKVEAEDQLRLFDRAHVAAMAEISRTIMALKGLRGD